MILNDDLDMCFFCIIFNVKYLLVWNRFLVFCGVKVDRSIILEVVGWYVFGCLYFLNIVNVLWLIVYVILCK